GTARSRSGVSPCNVASVYRPGHLRDQGLAPKPRLATAATGTYNRSAARIRRAPGLGGTTMPKISDEVRSERRQGLIEAAWRCASRQGYHAMTVDDVCIEAGVSKGAFYGYFDSKQHLLLTLLEEDAIEVDDIIADLAERQMEPVERLRAFAQAMVEHASDPARIQVRADLWSA